MKKTKPIKIYLDTSVYNRPFDDQGQTTVRLETEAFLSILEKAISGAIIIIGSSALLYENSLNPFPDRKERVSNYLSILSKFVKLNEVIKKATRHKDFLKIEVCSPLEFIIKEVFKNA